MGRLGGLGLDEIVNVYLDDVRDLDPKNVVADFIVEFNSGLDLKLEFAYDDDFWGLDMHGFSKAVLRFVTRYFAEHGDIPSQDVLEQEFQ